MTVLLIFAVCYVALAMGGIPGTRVDRTGVALIGAVLMLATGAVDLRHAAAAVDAPTILLLFGMMLVIGHLRLAGFFDVVSLWVLGRAATPFGLLAGTVMTSGVLSALFVNDIVCLVLTPLVVAVLAPLRLEPIPYLVALATASNVGSAATLTGNPQNMLIGSFSGIPYLTFAARITPAALIGLAVDVAVVAWVYRRVFFEPPAEGSRRWRLKRFERAPDGAVPAPVEARARRRARVHRPLLRTSLGVTGGLLVAFVTGVPIAVAAVAAAGALLVIGNVKPQKVYRQVDWGLLVLFAGLFIVIEGLEASGIVARAFAAAEMERLYRPLPLSALSLVLSNLVSNVPAVLLFRTVVPGFPDPEGAWLVLAMSSTFAGNLTLIGSVANLIVVEQGRSAGAPVVTFGEYLKVGVPVTLLTTLIGVALVGHP